MSGKAGAVPDDVLDAVAQAIHAHVCPNGEWEGAIDWHQDEYGRAARAVLSVPAVAEVFAKAALLDRVAEVVAGWIGVEIDPYDATSDDYDAMKAIAALLAEDGDR